MTGWLIKAGSRGAGPDASLVHEVFAIRHASAIDAVVAVEHKNGSYNPPPVTLCELPDDALCALGLTQEGQVALLRSEF
jgi:hypothetical protein